MVIVWVKSAFAILIMLENHVLLHVLLSSITDNVWIHVQLQLLEKTQLKNAILATLPVLLVKVF